MGKLAFKIFFNIKRTSIKEKQKVPCLEFQECYEKSLYDSFRNAKNMTPFMAS